VCVPEHASPVKVAAIRRYGVEVRVLGHEPAETERLARRLAAEADMSYISPYNDLDVIAGQGTVGEEIVQQLGGRAVDAVIVAVGGGGLISGTGAAIKSALPGVQVIGASPANDAAMAASVQAGKVVQVDTLPTISDGTSGGVEEGRITLPLCTDLSRVSRGFFRPSRTATPQIQVMRSVSGDLMADVLFRWHQNPPGAPVPGRRRPCPRPARPRSAAPADRGPAHRPGGW